MAAELLGLGNRLLSVEKPARYLGGEVGSIPREAFVPKDGVPQDGAQKGVGNGLLMALCFPDLYEIGMSNNAIRILYSALNEIEGLRCERVFAPAPDFESLLSEAALPLFTLESRTPLNQVDILGISLGYELAATSILAILRAGRVPLRNPDRREDDPIVIAGGPAISNPHPFGPFVDACYIGEAEASFYGLAREAARIKAEGAGRADILRLFASDPAVWLPLDSPLRRASQAGSGAGRARTVRAVAQDFAETQSHTWAPVASIKTVQSHGSVEIMRGCPNGCRFCHAGYYYRPQRLKSVDLILEEVRELVMSGGCREVTLSSLSSGDYPGVTELMDALNAEWSSCGVSFQLPSLRISTFNLPLLEKLSEVRKAGLTFAVETPEEAWQRVINKDVTLEQTVAILVEAKNRGYKLAKFYFMIGLPVPGGAAAEAESIIDFFHSLAAQVHIQMNVNVGTFVPKPHTPFQWCRQLGEEEAKAALRRVKDGLRDLRFVKVNYHEPFVSVLEGIISRGDERVGELILEAFKRGARLDAWDEHFRPDIWKAVLENASWPVMQESIKERFPGDALVWDDISIGISKKYLEREYQNAQEARRTSSCMETCTDPCGVCSDKVRIVHKDIHIEPHKIDSNHPSDGLSRLLFTFSKTSVARYLSHLNVMEALSRSFLMASIPVAFSEGFNPSPRLELVQPLPLGIASFGEAGSLMMLGNLNAFGASIRSTDDILIKINRHLPEGLRLETARLFPVIKGKKIHSLNGLSWGSVFDVRRSAMSPEGFSTLHSALTRLVAERQIPDAKLESLCEDSFKVLLPDPHKKEDGLLRLLEALLAVGSIHDALTISRVACLAKDPEGKPMEYASLFSLLADA